MLKRVHCVVEAAIEMFRTVYGGGGDGVRRGLWICENARGACVVIGRREVVARTRVRMVAVRDAMLGAGALVL